MDSLLNSPDSAGALVSLSSPLFAGAPEPLVKALISGCETADLEGGDRLLAAGEENDTLYLVVSGGLSVHVSGASGTVVELAPGDCAGELSLLDGFEVSADVYAGTATALLCIDREQLWHFLDQTPVVARNLLRILAGRVRNDNRMLQAAVREQRTLENAATVDALTGLRNRRWLNDAFDRQLHRTLGAGRPVSLLMVDIDHFKRVNDTQGHIIGDDVLVHAGRTLASVLRLTDLLARYGGEEFAIMLPDVPHAEAMSAAERLRREVEATPPEVAGRRLSPITVSIGVATTTPDAPLALQPLIDRADRHLVAAKAAGRNRVRG
jgi:diguanylate cyclase (GGDEF)-like protein